MFSVQKRTTTDSVGSNVQQKLFGRSAGGHNKMGSQRFNSESGRRQLPSDLDPGEQELLEAFDHWIHTAHPNPTREGCPHHSVLRSLVFGTGKFEDEAVLNHIGHCAACLDELQQIRRELSARHEK